MANGDDDPRVYQALALPEQALEKGGLEILRLGLVEDELYVTARPVLKQPSQWGEALAEVARRLGAIYAAQTQGLSAKDVTVQIAQAFAAKFGAQPIKAATKPAKKPAKQKSKPAPRRKKR